MQPLIESLHRQLCSTVKGSEFASVELIAAILADGHILIEGPPGVGKTTLANTLAQAVSAQFKRVQFTPDLMPSDLLGYSMFQQGENRFEFIEGPVFTNFLLADEINRTSPRIQSALLECMNERQVTIDGKTRALPELFHVIATRNNRFSIGTFPLPEPQLDRFVASIDISLPDPATQVSILEYHLNQSKEPENTTDSITSLEEITNWKATVKQLPASPEICQYIIRLCEEVRKHKEVESGLSNRASLGLMRFSQAIAFLNGNPAVYPDDVKRAFIPVLAHRINLSGMENRNRDPSENRQQAVALLKTILSNVAVD